MCVRILLPSSPPTFHTHRPRSNPPSSHHPSPPPSGPPPSSPLRPPSSPLRIPHSSQKLKPQITNPHPPVHLTQQVIFRLMMIAWEAAVPPCLCAIVALVTYVTLVRPYLLRPYLSSSPACPFLIPFPSLSIFYSLPVSRRPPSISCLPFGPCLYVGICIGRNSCIGRKGRLTFCCAV